LVFYVPFSRMMEALPRFRIQAVPAHFV
jgi:hypothetical protein